MTRTRVQVRSASNLENAERKYYLSMAAGGRWPSGRRSAQERWGGILHPSENPKNKMMTWPWSVTLRKEERRRSREVKINTQWLVSQLASTRDRPRLQGTLSASRIGPSLVPLSLRILHVYWKRKNTGPSLPLWPGPLPLGSPERSAPCSVFSALTTR